MANDSFKKIIENGFILYKCEYRNTINEQVHKEIVYQNSISVSEIASEVEESPVYNEHNTKFIKIILAYLFILGLFVIIPLLIDSNSSFLDDLLDDLYEIFNIENK
ncbi:MULTISPECIES: hypothetical protein [unclassified Lysinibacillus]|uniref:hypothetical protein n=1 Tax=unclassified Lysinibacillus TaxID=2636778 RepID=UPI0037F929FC